MTGSNFLDMGLNAKFSIEKLFLVHSKVILNSPKMFDPVLELVYVKGMHANNLREFLSEYTSSDISRYFTFSGN